MKRAPRCNALNNVLDGSQNTGANNLYGYAGDDMYIVGAGDVVYENAGEGTDTVIAGVTYSLAGLTYVENLTLTGTGNINGTGNTLGNVLIGNSGNNTLSGGAGADMISGGDGLDTLTGGTGADTFVFEAASAYNNIDIITDFTTGQSDVIDIRDLLGAYNGTDPIANFVQLVNSGSDDLLQVDRDGTAGGYGFTTIAKLSGLNNLDAATLVAGGNLVVHS